MTTPQIRGRVAVVTGAAQGLGQAYAVRLARDGALVVVSDVRDARETCRLIEETGGRAVEVRCDVGSPESISALTHAVAKMGGGDILVHNAGIYPMRRFEEIELEEWRHVMTVNLESLFLLARAFLPHMREQRWGRIIAVASSMFHQGLPGCAHYVASKGGVIGLVRALASEVGVDGVTVNAIAPGLIRTPGTSGGVQDALGMFEQAMAAQAIKRVAVPADLVGTVSFLASDDSAFITGQTLVLNGGRTMV